MMVVRYISLYLLRFGKMMWHGYPVSIYFLCFDLKIFTNSTGICKVVCQLFCVRKDAIFRCVQWAKFFFRGAIFAVNLHA